MGNAKQGPGGQMSEGLRKIKYAKKLLSNAGRVKNKGVSIISQNCVGGVIAHEYGLRFMSPTINVFIEDENFIKLVENLEHYMSVPAEPYIEEFVDPIDPSIKYPKIKIDDIEICCLHYKNCAEAVADWERRKKRVNLNNIRVIANSWNMHEDPERVKRICSTKYKTVCFTYGKYDEPCCIQLTDEIFHLDERSILRPNLTDFEPGTVNRYYERYFDFVTWMNEE